MSQALRLCVRLAEPMKNRANGTVGHWATRSRPAREIREAVFSVATRSELRREIERWTMRGDRAIPTLRACSWLLGDLIVLVTRVSPMPVDKQDGLPNACKPVIDAIGDALGLRNDRDPRVWWRYAQRSGDPAAEILIEQRRACAACGEGAESAWQFCPTCGQAFALVMQEQEQMTSKCAGRDSARSVR